MVLHGGNYSVYTNQIHPSKSGSGATGTWGISITGNAATATNATVASKLTTGDYGSSNRLFYLVGGVPTNSTIAVGSASRPVYFANGTITTCSDTLGVSVTGNAATASKWASARTITLTGAVTGSVSIDGSGNVSLATTYQQANIGNLDSRYARLNATNYFSNEQQDIKIINRASASGGGWAYAPLRIHNADRSKTLMYLGINGINNDLAYVYLGANDYNGQNLRITPYGSIICGSINPYANNTYSLGSRDTRWGASYFNEWLRMFGSGGIYWEDYGGGFNMTDKTWVRVYAGKALYCQGDIKSDALVTGAYFYANTTSLCPNLNAQYLNGQSLGNLDSRYVNASGDTMTGTLRVNNGVLSAGESQDDSYGYVNVCRPNNINVSCFSMIRQGTNAFGIGYDTSSNIWLGLATSSKGLGTAFVQIGNGNSTFNGTINCTYIYCRSSTLCSNLNADYLDGYNASSFAFTDGSNASGTWGISITGNASGNAGTATRLQTGRSINGTTFDGTAAITTSYWGTSRTFYIYDYSSKYVGAGVSVNGSGNVSLKLPATLYAPTGIWSDGYVSCKGQSTSDARMKEDITTFNGTSFIKGLNPKAYKWNSIAKAMNPVFNTDEQQYGLIAQEAESIAPFAVVPNMFGDGYYGIRYEKFIPILIQAEKETISRVELLENEVAYLRGELRKVKERLNCA